MDDAGDGRASAAAHIGGGACDGAGGRKAAEQRGDEVGRALGEQFLVGVVAVVDLAVGDARREQGFDGAEHGDGQRRGDQLAQVGQVELGKGQCGHGLRDAAEARADGVHRQVEQRSGGGADHQHAQRAGQAAHPADVLGQPVPADEQGQRGGGERDGGQMGGAEGTGERADFAEKLAGELVDLEAEEILDLREKDDHRDAVGETDDHRNRDEADHAAEAEGPHGDEYHPGQHGGDEQVGDAVVDHDGVDDRDEGAGRAADLNPRATQQGDQEAGDNGRPDAGGGRHPRGDSEGHGQRQGEHPDGNACARVMGELRAVVTGQGVEQPGMKAHQGSSEAGVRRRGRR